MGMTSDQLKELCRGIVYCKNLSLSYLNIGNISELDDVDENILALAVTRLSGHLFWEGAALVAR